ncbi:P-loop containing nucleoside triphosphate hydrolase protein [Hypoxylon rubiginosum]|uniref:P-loop containing nucleoside triphosphate hydrolase protein n=1 Tax=Hypoxylon rubiginosum TaxID=110542 RepID=A0ACC0D443_9PEZI|nr:P-loop containing nucleoside triphosphate hydrolase protein [Hypoxylon rubiginosum]
MDGPKQLLEYILTPSSEIFIVGAIIVLLLPILVHLYISRSTPYTHLPSIVLLGLPGGGKTSLLTLLERGDQALQTNTSQNPQSIELTVSDDHGASTFREAARDDAPGSHRKFLLIDTPGHPKLRLTSAMTHIASDDVKGIIYVLDASTLDEQLTDVATYLYDVLLTLQKRTGAGKTSKTPNAINVLVAVNKLDLFTATPATLVKSSLEAELGRIRQFRRKGLLESGVAIEDIGSEEQDNQLGEFGSEKFSFKQMLEFDMEVDVIGGSVLEGNVDKWWDWISGRI